MKRTGQALGSEYSTQQGANRRKIEGNHPAWFHALIPFRTAVPIRGQTCLIPSDLSPKRDWGPKRLMERPQPDLPTAAAIFDVGASP